jgi:hypothetical protein
LAGRGLSLDFGDARARIRSEVAALAPAIQRAYGEFAHDADAAFHDVAVRLRRRGGAERLGGARVELESDADIPFAPFPAGIHLPLLEWGLNYLLAQRLNHRLLVHAGVVELDGRAIVMPALPGTGKSTLTAALVTRGARLLSDEFGIVDLEDARLHPLVQAGVAEECFDRRHVRLRERRDVRSAVPGYAKGHGGLPGAGCAQLSRASRSPPSPDSCCSHATSRERRSASRRFRRRERSRSSR